MITVKYPRVQKHSGSRGHSHNHLVCVHHRAKWEVQSDMYRHVVQSVNVATPAHLGAPRSECTGLHRRALIGLHGTKITAASGARVIGLAARSSNPVFKVAYA